MTSQRILLELWSWVRVSVERRFVLVVFGVCFLFYVTMRSKTHSVIRMHSFHSINFIFSDLCIALGPLLLRM
jgi:hypothetical protein